MYDDFAHARSSDPETSHAAARTANVKGIDEIILKLIGENPAGLCMAEVTWLSEIGSECIAPRFAPLRRMGKIKAQGKRRGPSGKLGIAWILSDGVPLDEELEPCPTCGRR